MHSNDILSVCLLLDITLLTSVLLTQCSTKGAIQGQELVVQCQCCGFRRTRTHTDKINMLNTLLGILNKNVCQMHSSFMLKEVSCSPCHVNSHATAPISQPLNRGMHVFIQTPPRPSETFRTAPRFLLEV